MTDEGNHGLQFEKAEYGTSPPSETRCAACGQAIWDTYYAVNGKVSCERCKTDLDLQQRSGGGGVGRFVRATLYGTAARGLGAGIWYGVRAATGYEIGLIAIVVGLLVGGAVRLGSQGRGGRLYQTLAVFLTYTAIVSTYVPFIVAGLKQKWEESNKAPAAATATPGGESTQPAAPPTAPSPAPSPQPAAQEPSLARALLGLLVLALLIMVLAFAAPFLAGLQNIVGLLIIGFGLWEAWKINRRTPLEITGPHRVGAAPAPGV